MFAPLFALAAVIGALPGFHVVENAATEQLAVVRGANGIEALFVVRDAERPSELRAVQMDPQKRVWSTARVVFRGDAIGKFAVDEAAGVVLVALNGHTPGVAIAPLAAQSDMGSAGFVALPDVAQVVACGGRRIATGYVDGKMTAFDLAALAVGARLDRPPPAPPMLLATLFARAVRADPVTLSCSGQTLTAFGPRELVVFDGAAPTRVPWSSRNGGHKGVFALANGDLLVWKQWELQVIDRAGNRKAALGGQHGSVHVVSTPLGPRLITTLGSYALPLLNDARVIDGPANAVAALDDGNAVALTYTGLRARAFLPTLTATNTTTLHKPTRVARRADGKRFAIGEEGGDLVVFERPRPDGPWRVSARLHDHFGAVIGVAYVDAAVAGTVDDALVTVSKDGLVHIYAEATLERVRSIPLDDLASDAVFDARRGRVAVTLGETIAIVDLKSGAVQTLGPLPVQGEASRTLGAFSPDGTQLAFVDDMGRARLYSLLDGREDRRIADFHFFVAFDARGQLVEFTPDAVRINGRAHATYPTSHPARAILDPATGELWLSGYDTFGPLRHQRESERPVADLVLDRGRVITVDADDQVVSWPRSGGSAQVVFGRKLRRIESMGFIGEDVAISWYDDVRVCVASRDGRVRDLEPPWCVYRNNTESLTPARWAVRPAHGGANKTLIGATPRGELSFDLVTGARTCPPDLGLEGFSTEVAGFSADGRGVVVDLDEGVLVVGAKKQKLARAPHGFGPIDAAVVSGDGSVVAYVDRSDGAHAVRVKDGVEIGRTRGGDLAALPGGRFLLGRWPVADNHAEESAHAIAVWEPGSGAPRPLTHAYPFTNHLVATPDGKHFLHTAHDEVWVRSMDTGEVRAVVSIGFVEALAVAADGTHFAVADGGRVSVYDLDGVLLWAVDIR